LDNESNGLIRPDSFGMETKQYPRSFSFVDSINFESISDGIDYEIVNP